MCRRASSLAEKVFVLPPLEHATRPSLPPTFARRIASFSPRGSAEGAFPLSAYRDRFRVFSLPLKRCHCRRKRKRTRCAYKRWRRRNQPRYRHYRRRGRSAFAVGLSVRRIASAHGTLRLYLLCCGGGASSMGGGGGCSSTDY